MGNQSINIEKVESGATVNIYNGKEKENRETVTIAAIDKYSTPLRAEIELTPWGKSKYRVAFLLKNDLLGQVMQQNYLTFSSEDKAKEMFNKINSIMVDFKTEAEENLVHSAILVPKIWNKMAELQKESLYQNPESKDVVYRYTNPQIHNDFMGARPFGLVFHPVEDHFPEHNEILTETKEFKKFASNSKDISITIPEIYIKTINEMVAKAKPLGMKIYAVGGFVRDLLMGKTPKDLDVMVNVIDQNLYQSKLQASGLQGENVNPSALMSLQFSERLSVGESFGINPVKTDIGWIEIAFPRAEEYSEDSRKPKTSLTNSLTADAMRRDFGMNALFLDLESKEILDLTGHGLKDIQDRTIRITDPEAIDTIFTSDPLRILRCFRFAQKMGFTIDPQIINYIQERPYLIAPKGEQIDANFIPKLSSERIKDEFVKIIAQPNAAQVLKQMNDLGLLQYIIKLPENAQPWTMEHKNRHHYQNVFDHTLTVVEKLENILQEFNIDNPDLVWKMKLVALLHDVGKLVEQEGFQDIFDEQGQFLRRTFHGHAEISEKITTEALKRLKFSNEDIDYISKLVYMHDSYYDSKNLNNSRLLKFVKKFGGSIETAKQMLLVEMADRQAHVEGFNDDSPLRAAYEALNENFEVKEKQKLEAILNGGEIMQLLNVPAGQIIGQVKNFLIEARIQGLIVSKEDAISLLAKTKEIVDQGRNDYLQIMIELLGNPGEEEMFKQESSEMPLKFSEFNSGFFSCAENNFPQKRDFQDIIEILEEVIVELKKDSPDWNYLKTILEDNEWHGELKKFYLEDKSETIKIYIEMLDEELNEKAANFILREIKIAEKEETNDYDIYEDYSDRYNREGTEALESYLLNKGKEVFYNNKVIPKNRIKKIWYEFGKHGSIDDVDGLLEIKENILDSIARLNFLTEIQGHSQSDPKEIIEMLGYENNINLDNNEEFYDFFSDENGQGLLSDYGLKPLNDLYFKIIKENDLTKLIYLIDRALNVFHQRSDLASLFIEGGTKTLMEILNQGGYTSEAKNKNWYKQAHWYKKAQSLLENQEQEQQIPEQTDLGNVNINAIETDKGQPDISELESGPISFGSASKALQLINQAGFNSYLSGVNWIGISNDPGHLGVMETQLQGKGFRLNPQRIENEKEKLNSEIERNMAGFMSGFPQNVEQTLENQQTFNNWNAQYGGANWNFGQEDMQRLMARNEEDIEVLVIAEVMVHEGAHAHGADEGGAQAAEKDFLRSAISAINQQRNIDGFFQLPVGIEGEN